MTPPLESNVNCDISQDCLLFAVNCVFFIKIIISEIDWEESQLISRLVTIYLGTVNQVKKDKAPVIHIQLLYKYIYVIYIIVVLDEN